MTSFKEFEISAETLSSLEQMGIQTPTEIQTKTLPILLKEKRDLIGLAATGTGKTAAFGIPLIESIEPRQGHIQALVLAPTRELALQVSQQLSKIGRGKGVRTATVYGGQSYVIQKKMLRENPEIVVATPGRLIDLLEQKVLQLNSIQTLVLDEADEMISMGFQDDLETILAATHKDGETSSRASCKTWFFSATLSPFIRKVADRYLENPAMVSVQGEQKTATTIEQTFIPVFMEDKIEVLSRLLSIEENFHGIIFCQMKSEVSHTEEVLARKGYAVGSLHGDKTQREREQILNRFKRGDLKVLIATDVAARGLDIQNLSHVINHSLPRELESYIHRIGRTGRAGQQGKAISLVAPDQLRVLKRVEQMTKAPIKLQNIPKVDDVLAVKVKNFREKLQSAPEEKIAVIKERMQQMFEVGELNMFEQEIWARLIFTQFSDLLREDRNIRQPELQRSRPSEGRGGDRRSDGRFDRPRRSGGGSFRGGRRGDDEGRTEYRSDRRSEGRSENRFERSERPERRSERGSERGGEQRTERRSEGRFERSSSEGRRDSGRGFGARSEKRESAFKSRRKDSRSSSFAR